jgi:hypothetical protein
MARKPNEFKIIVDWPSPGRAYEPGGSNKILIFIGIFQAVTLRTSIFDAQTTNTGQQGSLS